MNTEFSTLIPKFRDMIKLNGVWDQLGYATTVSA